MRINPTRLAWLNLLLVTLFASPVLAGGGSKDLTLDARSFLPEGSATCDGTPEATPRFTVRIEQDGHPVSIGWTFDLALNPAPFVIVVRMACGSDGIDLNGSLTPDTYSAAVSRQLLQDLAGFVGTGIADFRGNPERNLLTSEDCFNYWYYHDEVDNRFDSCERLDETTLECRRTVDQVDSVPVTQLAGQVLYLVFIQEQWVGETRVELGRVPLAIQFLPSE